MVSTKPMKVLTTALLSVLVLPTGGTSPVSVSQVVTLLTELKSKIEADGSSEQRSYDQYACWCEDTLSNKASTISSTKDTIESLQTNIVKLKGDLGSLAESIKQTKKDIDASIESQNEAREVREKETSDYNEEKTESEQCIGALEAAIKVLTGAGGKRGFLETLQEAQLLSVVAGVRRILRQPSVARTVSDKDLQVVRHFLDRPEEFVGGRTGVLSAAQIANNPFGDYAPQSTQIQGILKGMYDTFTSDLERMNAEEATKQKGFLELMATKQQEQQTLEATLQRETSSQAEKDVQLANDKTSLDDSKEQLAADEAFFKQTKSNCQEKASQWAERTRLRTEELHSIGQAVGILSSDEATETFGKATTTLLQISAHSHGEDAGSRNKAYERLRTLASKYRSISLAKLAIGVKTSGHFDKVIASIDQMMEVLRKEEQADIVDRDWCQKKQGKNKNDMEDLNYDITKANQTIGRLETMASTTEAEIGTLDDNINTTKTNMNLLLQMRNEERNEHIQAVKDDQDAIDVLDRAIMVLTRFYRKNGVPLSLSQKKLHDEPPPRTAWSEGDYTGGNRESGGIVAILLMLKEDFEKEIQTGRQDDAAAQAAYESDRKALKDTLDSYMASKVTAEKHLAALRLKTADTQELRSQKGADLQEEQGMEAALSVNCEWVETHFQSRRDKRKTEMDGLVEAKNFLAGVDAGDALV